jgi:ADP-dependent NAD(P)H-hydrate dehydratase / NAD(P)H-hydrate epimerase
MKIFSAEQIREWDAFTIANTPITSLELMERAADQCFQWLLHHGYEQRKFTIFCGKGNNGGDGLAIARMLWNQSIPVTVYILEFGHLGTADFQVNLEKLQATGTDIHFVQSPEHLHKVPPDHIILDALFGSGLNRAPVGLPAGIIAHINASNCEVIAIDIPSGMPVDSSGTPGTIVKASHTLAFQAHKLAFLLPQNAAFVGAVHLLHIGLHPAYQTNTPARYEWVDADFIKDIFHPRNAFAHKGDFGHALLIAGSRGKMGAAILAARACLRSGAGLLSCCIPADNFDILQTAVPEAMALEATEAFAAIGRYRAIGIGPGIGNTIPNADLLKQLLSTTTQPLVLDADALNILAAHEDLQALLPPSSILTPHLREFERLFGYAANDFERVALAMQQARALNVIIVLKGHHTLIAMPGGKGYFNSTGNAGMATGGSGDVLTGIITALLAQQYTPEQSAILGVYLHGLAGDMTLQQQSEESLVAGDIVEGLGAAFKKIRPLP